VFIVEGLKVLCFDTDLQVFILRELAGGFVGRVVTPLKVREFAGVDWPDGVLGEGR